MRYINTVTPFEQTHLDPTTTTVAPHTVDIKSALGFDLTEAEIIRLCGAPTGSTITVFHQTSWPTEPVETPPSGVFFKVQNSRYIRTYNVVGVFYDTSAASYGLYLKLIDISHSGPRRMAARMLAVMVRQAMLIEGLTFLRLLAAGGRSWQDLDQSTGERWGGFYAWPRYGFDMPLSQETIDVNSYFPEFPRQLATCMTVRDILNISGGSVYWKTVGDGWYMEFDLSSTSTDSIQILDNVLQQERI